MKKRASTILLLMWVMVIYHCVAAVSGMSKSNVTTSLCDGSVEDCLNAIHLDSQLPTISSSHFRRILAQNDKQVTDNLQTSDQATKCRDINKFYRKCGANTNPGLDKICAHEQFNRNCPNINPQSQWSLKSSSIARRPDKLYIYVFQCFRFLTPLLMCCVSSIGRVSVTARISPSHQLDQMFQKDCEHVFICMLLFFLFLFFLFTQFNNYMCDFS